MHDTRDDTYRSIPGAPILRTPAGPTRARSGTANSDILLKIYGRSGLYLIRPHGGHALRVAAVAPTGPAERAGVQTDDRVTAIDGARIETRRVWQWRAYLREHAPGTHVVLRIERAGTAQRDVTIELAELVP